MNECIYCKKSNWGFNSRENVIPAFLGGIKKLDKGLVSDEEMAQKYSNKRVIEG